ncbi:hypothetical protein HC891_28120, partial [Candidatus Gracilibacteria bacterium]|nr:hypothetical protein [Candidatus Gracilibacteria bacterium]
GCPCRRPWPVRARATARGGAAGCRHIARDPRRNDAGLRRRALAAADGCEAVALIADHIRRIQPQVVVTFGPDGATGHPDHIAICQLTTAAVLAAAPCRDAAAPHQVAKLYYLADSRERMAVYAAAFGDTAMTVDGVVRHVPGWEPWAITTCIDTQAYAQQAWRAIACHRSQLPAGIADQLTVEQHQLLWGVQEFYRVFSLVNSGQALEDDLFAGVERHAASMPSLGRSGMSRTDGSARTGGMALS